MIRIGATAEALGEFTREVSVFLEGGGGAKEAKAIGIDLTPEDDGAGEDDEIEVGEGEDE
jgi:hypothetical protein